MPFYMCWGVCSKSTEVIKANFISVWKMALKRKTTASENPGSEEKVLVLS